MVPKVAMETANTISLINTRALREKEIIKALASAGKIMIIISKALEIKNMVAKALTEKKILL